MSFTIQRVDIEPVRRGVSKAPKIARAASLTSSRRGKNSTNVLKNSTNVVKNVTPDTRTKIPVPTFPASKGRTPSRSFANNSILSLDTSFDVSIHQSTAV